ncbi:MAG: hypothetical protein HYZ50_18405 [Deltaproteobacteria bacterium]|nr:hypothetical protein [Deltaproteobacteria bacterium]
MARKANRSETLPEETWGALSEYLAELAELCPGGLKKYRVLPWPEYGEGSYLVKIAPLASEEQWIEISERMAEVGTRILAKSDQLFILTA